MPSIVIKSAAKVISPNPPIWISTAMTTCPISVKSDPVSTTTSPVTVTAEAAVKTASPKLTAPVWLKGSARMMAPRRIKSA